MSSNQFTKKIRCLAHPNLLFHLIELTQETPNLHPRELTKKLKTSFLEYKRVSFNSLLFTVKNILQSESYYQEIKFRKQHLSEDNNISQSQSSKDDNDDNGNDSDEYIEFDTNSFNKALRQNYLELSNSRKSEIENQQKHSSIQQENPEVLVDENLKLIQKNETNFDKNTFLETTKDIIDTEDDNNNSPKFKQVSKKFGKLSIPVFGSTKISNPAANSQNSEQKYFNTKSNAKFVSSQQLKDQELSKTNFNNQNNVINTNNKYITQSFKSNEDNNNNNYNNNNNNNNGNYPIMDDVNTQDQSIIDEKAQSSVEDKFNDILISAGERNNIQTIEKLYSLRKISKKEAINNSNNNNNVNNNNNNNLNNYDKLKTVSKKRSRSDDSDSTSKSTNKKNRPNVRYSDLGGIENIMQDVRELIEYPLIHPEIFQHLGVSPPRGILLHGPPGCGKTQLARAIAGEIDVSFFQISAPEIVSGMSGESEAKIRQLFQEAKNSCPSIIFIDEIDAITPKRESAAREMERRIVAQLLTSMDDLADFAVTVIGATNRPDALDVALRRGGRFDREICLGVPDESARVRILKVISSKLRLDGDFDFNVIARKTPGYVGADLQSVVKEAATIAIHRIFKKLENNDKIQMNNSLQTKHSQITTDFSMDLDSNSNLIALDETCTPAYTNEAYKNKDIVVSTNNINNNDISHTEYSNRSFVSDLLRRNREPFTPEQLSDLYINMNDFLLAIKRVQPSAKREGFATIPNVVWEDIGALSSIRKELEMSILEPIRSKAKFNEINLTAPAGVLLFGPPGCGKTLLAKAVANQAQSNFISVKGPELLNKFVGESERSVRLVFERARASSPCIIFFDEIDALVPRRSSGENAATERVVNQLLVELDGLEKRQDIFVIAATNRPDIIDPAMLRPGRIDKLLYVPLPTPEERYSILMTCTRKTPMARDVDLLSIALNPKCDNFSGADISSLVREASVITLEKHLKDQMPLIVTSDDFEQAMNKVNPSVSRADRNRYNSLQRLINTPKLVPNEFEEKAIKNKQQ